MSANQYTAKEQKYIQYQHYQIDAADHEDHSFNGICFDIRVKEDQPVKEVVITAFGVRGELGDVSIYVTKPEYRSYYGRNCDSSCWDRVFTGNLDESWAKYKRIELSEPIIMEPGSSRGVYIHSREEHDQGIVYDNYRSKTQTGDTYVEILPGCAQTGNIPFSTYAGWGWRSGRQFVGQVFYGVRHMLWACETHKYFPRHWRQQAESFIVMNETNSTGIYLPPEIVRYILNFCGFDHFPMPQGGLTVGRGGENR